MDKFEGYVFAALCSTNFLVSCLIFSKVTREQREPYMDEIFHIPQAQKYCQGKFSEVKELSLFACLIVIMEGGGDPSMGIKVSHR